MERIRRRTFVSGLGAAITGALTMDAAVSARQDAAAPRAQTLEPELFGTATRTGALQGATFHR